MANYKFIGGDGKEYGPYSAEQMRQFLSENRLVANSQVSADGGPFQPASTFPELGSSPAQPPMGGPTGPQAYQTMPGSPQPQYPGTAGHLKPDRGTLILVLGILSFIACGIFTAIPAWIMGHNDLKEIDAGRMNPAGRSNTNAGRICGMIGTILTGVIILGWGVLFGCAIMAGA